MAPRTRNAQACFTHLSITCIVKPHPDSFFIIFVRVSMYMQTARVTHDGAFIFVAVQSCRYYL